jgi:hypothetical protein
MGNCDDARTLIAFGVGLLLLSGLGAAVSWAYAVRVVRASHAAMREVNALRSAYLMHPVALREAPHQPPDSSPLA